MLFGLPQSMVHKGVLVLCTIGVGTLCTLLVIHLPLLTGSLRVNSNVPAVNALRNLDRTQKALHSTIERLSSGLRINSASDDAAGLAVSDRLHASIRSLAQAERNAADAISMVDTSEAALNEISAILVRMRELATQSANGNLTETDRKYLDEEFEELNNEIDRIAQATEFNGAQITDDSVSFHAGASEGTTVSESISGGVRLLRDRINHVVEGIRATSLTTFNASTMSEGEDEDNIEWIDEHEFEALYGPIERDEVDFTALLEEVEKDIALVTQTREDVLSIAKKINEDSTKELEEAKALLKEGKKTSRKCPSKKKLVCGSDGITYDNACLAKKAGIKVARKGACR